MKSTLPIQWLKSSVHYQPNLSFDLALQLMVYVRTRVHQVFANWWATSACIGYELVGIVSSTRLPTRANRFSSREFDIGEKCSDSA